MFQKLIKISLVLFLLLFNLSSVNAAPNAVTLTVSNGSSSQSGSPISGSISLRYFATSVSDVASIQVLLKSMPAGAPSPTVSGGSGSVTPVSDGTQTSLILSPFISPTVAGTYTYTVVATFNGSP